MRPALAYGSNIAMAIAVFGMLRDWTWARITGRVLCWINVFLFAMLVVPDWDEAEFTASYGLHYWCGVLAAYFLLVAICLGFGRGGKSVTA
jgi:hypothetical protein